MKGFFVTVEIQRCSGSNIFQNLITTGCDIRMFWVENFLKINKPGGMYIRDLRVTRYNFNQVRCFFLHLVQISWSNGIHH